MAIVLPEKEGFFTEALFLLEKWAVRIALLTALFG